MQRWTAGNIRHLGGDLGDELEGLPQHAQFSRTDRAGERSVCQALDVPDLVQRLPNRGARQRVGHVVLDRVLATVNLLQIEERLSQPAPQQAGAHRCAGLVEHGKQSVPFLAASAFCQLQIAARLEVQLHEAGRAIGVDRGDLDQRGALGVGEVGEQSPGRLNGHPLFRQTEPIKRLHREMLQQRFSCPLCLPEPGIGAADCQTRWQPLLGQSHHPRDRGPREGRLRRRRDAALHGQRRHAPRRAIRRRAASPRTRPWRDPRRRSPPAPVADDRRDVGVAVAVEHRRVGHRPRRHDAGHVAVDQGPAAVQTADLLADGDFVTGRDEPRDVTVSRMVRDPGHGNADALAHLPAGEHDVQDTRRGFRIVLECLVEIPEAKEEDGVRESLFDLEILAANRGHCLERGAALRLRRVSVWQQRRLRVGGQCALSFADLSARGGERGRLGYAVTRAYARSERRPCRKWQSREG